MLIASARSTVQLLLLGLVLKALFSSTNPWLVAALATVMLAVAGYEVMARQKYRFRGLWGYGTGALSMFLSSFSIAVLTLLVLLQPDPWYTPQYADPPVGHAARQHHDRDCGDTGQPDPADPGQTPPDRGTPGVGAYGCRSDRRHSP